MRGAELEAALAAAVALHVQNLRMWRLGALESLTTEQLELVRNELSATLDHVCELAAHREYEARR